MTTLDTNNTIYSNLEEIFTILSMLIYSRDINIISIFSFSNHQVENIMHFLQYIMQILSYPTIHTTTYGLTVLHALVIIIIY